MTKLNLLIIIMMLTSLINYAQTGKISGKILNTQGGIIESATINIPKLKIKTKSDKKGNYLFENIPYGTLELEIKHKGFEFSEEIITINNDSIDTDFYLEEESDQLEEVVISGTMKEVSKLSSPVPIEVYTSKFFKANPTPSLFDALQNINGVRPQLNCNVCNTGDIHINGLEGPYTMILIDGMPIVSGLSTVYGLSGIPQALIDRGEVVKGPASTLYGSEAVGGLINVITKRPGNAPLIAIDAFGTSWGEINTDVAAKFNVGKKAQSLLGISYFNYSNPIDNNNDNFTDVTLQNRISVFNKWNFNRKDNRIFTIAGRYVYEDRWGGEMNWTKKYRGGDEVYGESIYISRWELFGTYQLPLKEKILFQLSTNEHDQNSAYGNIPYIADQKNSFRSINLV